MARRSVFSGGLALVGLFAAARPASAVTAGVAIESWAPSTTYHVGDQVVSPANDVVSSLKDHTSGSSFDPTLWSLSATFAEVGALATKVDKGTLVVSVRDYGAKGDGIADDTAAITAALSAAGSSTVVFLPAGRYLVSATLTLRSGTQLRGVSAAATTLVATGNFNAVVTASASSRCAVQDLSIVNTSTSGSTTCACILLNGGTGHSVLRCRVQGGRYGINVNGATNILVHGNEVTGQNGLFATSGIYLTGTSAPVGCRIDSNAVHGVTSGAGIFANFASADQDVDCQLLILGNSVTDVTDNGIRVQTRAGRQQGNYVVRDNTVSNAAVNGIRVNGYGASVTNNTVRGGTAGIRDGGGVGGTWVERSTISGNHLYGRGLSGAGIQLQVGSRQVRITGNHAEGWNYGIYVGENAGGTGPTSGHSITGNTCQLNGREGIVLLSCSSSILSGNICRSNGQASTGRSGILVAAGSAKVTITGNASFSDPPPTQAYGFSMTADVTGCLVTGNNWSGNQRAAIYAPDTTQAGNIQGP